jgi:hypothetical protein
MRTPIIITLLILLNGCAASEEYRARKAEIDALSAKTAKNVRFDSAYKDGGTRVVEAYIDGKKYEFYIDFRIYTRTLGRIYSDYPSDKNAIMLDPNSPLALSIQKN